MFSILFSTIEIDGDLDHFCVNEDNKKRGEISERLYNVLKGPVIYKP